MGFIFEKGEDKYIFHIPLDDEWKIRMDSVNDDGHYKLAIIDSYTLPLKNIASLPFCNYEPLPQLQEMRMREEYRITKIINDYIRLKDIIGKEKAINWFKDGQEEKKVYPHGCHILQNERHL